MADHAETIGAGELAITVEMGNEFEPGARTAAALQELVQALHEEHGDQVAGFSMEPQPVRSFSFGFSPEPNRSFEAWPSKWKMASFDGKSDAGTE